MRDGKKLSWEEAMAQFRDALAVQVRRIGFRESIRKDRRSIPSPGSVGTKPQPMPNSPARACPQSITGTALLDLPPPRSSSGSAISEVSASFPSAASPTGPWGTYDMAGNVKEWIATESDSGKRWVLGGAWDEPTYMFVDPDAQSPWLRAPTSVSAPSSTSIQSRFRQGLRRQCLHRVAT